MTTSGAGPIAAVGVFQYREDALRAVGALRAAGFRDDQIGLLGPAPAEGTPPGAESPADAGAAIGGAAGGLTGLGLGFALTAGVLAPVGLVVAGGPLVALLAGLGGGVIGAAVGRLAGLNVPEEDARRYEAELAAGRTLVTVHGAGDRAGEARTVLRHSGGTEPDPGVGPYRASGEMPGGGGAPHGA